LYVRVKLALNAIKRATRDITSGRDGKGDDGRPGIYKGQVKRGKSNVGENCHPYLVVTGLSALLFDD